MRYFGPLNIDCFIQINYIRRQVTNVWAKTTSLAAKPGRSPETIGSNFSPGAVHKGMPQGS